MASETELVLQDDDIQPWDNAGYPAWDVEDYRLVRQRLDLRIQIREVLEGDWIKFADGVYERIVHVWEHRVQTYPGGRFYLGAKGRISHSGSLNTGVRIDTLTLTDELRPGSAWVFHHDWAMAHNGVDFSVRLRVWESSEMAAASH